MNLNDELFEQVVTSLAAGEATTLPDVAGATAAGSPDQRRARRFAADAGARIRLIPLTDALAPGPVDVVLRDISPGGAGFYFNARIALDEQFVLILPAQHGQVAVLCAVAYWQPVGPNLFAIGAKFTRVLRQTSAAPDIQPPVPVRQAV